MKIFALRSALLCELEDLDDNRTLEEIAEPAFDQLATATTLEDHLAVQKDALELEYLETIDENENPVFTWETTTMAVGSSSDQLTIHDLLDDGDLVGRISVLETDVD